ncbi:MAG: DivIVA domain-containing protein [Epulopiscium sp.]|nr:DivIVA domain-containing protein [Candidatus Epulonipiscium sp.]
MLTPLDIESKEFKRMPLGYSIDEVDRFLDEVIESYEKLYRENIELKDKIAMLNEGIQYYKTMENTLQNTLILAEKTAEETKNSAYQKGEHIKREAELKSHELIQQARAEVFQIQQSIEHLKNQHEAAKTQLKYFLQTQLELTNQSNFMDMNFTTIENTNKKTTLEEEYNDDMKETSEIGFYDTQDFMSTKLD